MSDTDSPMTTAADAEAAREREMRAVIEPCLVYYIPNRDIRGLVVGDIARALVQALADAGARARVEEEKIAAVLKIAMNATTGHFYDCLAGQRGAPLGDRCSELCRRMVALLVPKGRRDPTKEAPNV